MLKKNTISIGNRNIGEGEPTFIIAELSANHNGSLENAKQIIKAASKAGVDAIKLQTYTADTITLDCNNEYFQVIEGTIWEGRTLYDLYQEAHLPWEWHKELIEYAKEQGLICFSSPFDFTAVDFLEELNVPAYKVASFEINDIRLIEYVASKGKPVIISTGVATLGEIQEALDACKRSNNNQIILLKCCSAYPAPMESINLKVIPNMKETFHTVVGLSDHTMGHTVALGAVALGANVVEKHITLDRKAGGVDSSFSMEPDEFFEMVKAIRDMEKALGTITYELTEKQIESTKYKRSLFVCEDIKEGEIFTEKHIKSIRPSNGISTKYYNQFIGKAARYDIKKGTPVSWNMI